MRYTSCPFALGRKEKSIRIILKQVCVLHEFFFFKDIFKKKIVDLFIITIAGHYVCSKCEHQLFGSESKYSHETPWPAFKNPILENSLSKKLEKKGAFKVRSF